jgi:hypothetical protein
VPLVIAVVLLFGLMVFMWVAIAREPGPGPSDVALAYERAWDEFDFGLLYDLSGEEMHDGLRRERFIAAKRSAYANTDTAGQPKSDVSIETSVAGHQTALVVTRVEAQGTAVRNNVMLERRSNGWVVVSYSLRADGEQSLST